MSSRATKYASNFKKSDYTFHPARLFSLEWNEEHGNCYLLALSHYQITVLERMLAVFPKYYWVWGIEGPKDKWDLDKEEEWEKICDFVEELEACLRMGCEVQGLTDGLSMIAQKLDETNARLSVMSESSQLVANSADNIDDKLGYLKTISRFGSYFDAISSAIENIEIVIPRPLNFGPLVGQLARLNWLIGRPSSLSGSTLYQWFANWVGLDNDPDTYLLGIAKQQKDAMYQTASPLVSITDTLENVRAQLETNGNGNDTAEIVAEVGKWIDAIEKQEIKVIVNANSGDCNA